MGTRFIQITYGSWDHHQNLYARLTTMAGIFDAGLARLIADLKSDGLLDETLIVAQGEFGRTVGSLNGNQGRDHYSPQAVLFAGAKTRGGRAVGSSDSSGRFTADPGWSRDRDVRAEISKPPFTQRLGSIGPHCAKIIVLVVVLNTSPMADQDLYGPVHELW